MRTWASTETPSGWTSGAPIPRPCPCCSRRSSSGRSRKSRTRSSGATPPPMTPRSSSCSSGRATAGRATRSACRSTSTAISPEPEWPDGVSVRTMREGEERRVYEAQMASFADTWMFAPDPYDSLAALDGRGARRSTVPCGSSRSRKTRSRASSSRERPRTSPASAGCASWVSCPSTANAASGRRCFSTRSPSSRGAASTAVGLGVDAENPTGAVRVYERAGMHVERTNLIFEKLQG